MKPSGHYQLDRSGRYCRLRTRYATHKGQGRVSDAKARELIQLPSSMLGPHQSQVWTAQVGLGSPYIGLQGPQARGKTRGSSYLLCQPALSWWAE